MKGKMLLGYSLVKNEEDIIDTFINLNIPLFDRFVIFDHSSSDRTRRHLNYWMNKFSNLTCLSLEMSGYYQAELSNIVARCYYEKYGSHCFLPLDADEFLRFDTKSNEVRKLILSHPSSFYFYWQNIYKSQDRFYLLHTEKFKRKICLNLSLLKIPTLRISQGNHSLTSNFYIHKFFSLKNFLPLYHYPIRSRKQLLVKLEQGLKAYSEMTNPKKSDGFHWRQLSTAIEAGIDDNDYRKFIANYSFPISEHAEIISEFEIPFRLQYSDPSNDSDMLPLVKFSELSNSLSEFLG